jgi:hypothetical protein
MSKLLGGVAVAKKTELISVKIRADVYRLVKTVAAWKGETVAEYLSEIALPPARRDFERMKANDRAWAEDEE